MYNILRHFVRNCYTIVRFNFRYSNVIIDIFVDYFRTFCHLLEMRVPPPDEDGCSLVPLLSELVKFIENGLEIK